jgi:hypothetical protein
MHIALNVTFEVAGWESVPYDETQETAQLSQVTITKKFGGDLEGGSIARGLFCKCADESASYVVVERVEGKTADREGTFVIQHGGIISQGTVSGQFGDVIPGSGTGGFAGIGGKVLFTHDENGAFVKMDLTFE